MNKKYKKEIEIKYIIEKWIGTIKSIMKKRKRKRFIKKLKSDKKYQRTNNKNII